MPVFVGRKILGVVQSVPPKFNARKLFATPVWQLLEDQRFRDLIGYDEQRAHLAKIKGRLVKALARSSSAVEAVAGQLGMPDEPAGLEGEPRVDRLAERLLETDIRPVIQALRAAHRSLCEDDGGAAEQSASAAETLAKAAQLIVPALYDYGVIKWTGSQFGAAVVALPASIKTVAEIIMAGVDGRETRLRHREAEDDQPEGELSLPQIPECGIDPAGAKARTALQDHLSRKFSPEATDAQTFRRAIDDYLLAAFSRPQRGAPEGSAQERIKLTADLLTDKRRDSGQTFYMLFYLPEDAEGQNAVRTLVQSLKDDYPAIMFLGLDASFEQERQDRALVDPFCRMLPLKPQESPEKGDAGP